MNTPGTTGASAPNQENFPLISTEAIGNQSVQTVNARELHEYLGLGKDFSNWIKDRIRQYEFLENQDFVIFANSGEKSGRGRPSKEYHISIHMGKELAMVERNEKGRKVRRYFIECERRLKEGASITEDRIAAIATQAVAQVIKALVPELVKAELKADPRHQVVEGYISTREILDQKKVPPKGRRGLIVKASRSLRDFTLCHSQVPKRCGRTQTWLYPNAVVPTWLREIGSVMIKTHLDAMSGQNVLPFEKGEQS